MSTRTPEDIDVNPELIHELSTELAQINSPGRGRIRVAIIGMGHIGPLGLYGTLPDGTKVTEAWDNVLAGVNGIKLISHKLFPEYKKYPNIETKLGGFVERTDEDLDELLENLGSVSDLEFKSRAAKLGEIATKLALFDAGLMVPFVVEKGIRRLESFRLDPAIADDTATIGGTGMGGAADSIVVAQRELEERAQTNRKIDPVHVFRALPGGIEESVTMDEQIHGSSFGVLGECATGGITVGIGKMVIDTEEAVAAVLDNAESTTLEPLGVALFDALGANTKRTDPNEAPTSFDETNDGFAFGEAGQSVVLMREDLAVARGHHIYAIVAGCGATSDGSHPSFPREDGKYQKLAMQKALERAGGLPQSDEAFVWIRSHATGTKPPIGESADAIEARVTREAIEEQLARTGDPRSFEEVVAGTSSLKPLTGHLLGADGLFGVMLGALAIQDGKMPGNWKTQALIPAAKLLKVIVNETRVGKVLMVIINTFGFGGKNASVVLKAPNL